MVESRHWFEEALFNATDNEGTGAPEEPEFHFKTHDTTGRDPGDDAPAVAGRYGVPYLCD